MQFCTIPPRSAVWLRSFLPFLLLGILPGGWAQSGRGELLRNGAFEGGSGSDGRGAGVPDWRAFGRGYEIERQTRHGGDQCIRCDSVSQQMERGAQTTLTLNQTRATPLLVAGWSRADQVAGAVREDYALRVDLLFTDGSRQTGPSVGFHVGTHGWERRQLLVTPTKPIAEVTIIALFQHHSGTAWFDDFTLNQQDGAGIFDGQPLSLPRRTAVEGPIHRIAGRDGLALEFDGQGDLAGVTSSGQAISGSGVGGFYLRDVGADGPIVSLRGPVTPRKAGGYNFGSITGGLNVRFSARIYAEASSGTIALDGELTDTTNRDRALTVYFALPIRADGWTWGRNAQSTRREPGHDAEMTGPGEWSDQTRVNVGATGGLAQYPFCGIGNGQAGVGIGSQMDWPSVYRMFYNGSTHHLVIAWDVALTGKTAAWPSHNARFRCRLFRLPPGSRADLFPHAAQRFYALNAPNYTPRSRPGAWIGDNSTALTDPADFGLAYHAFRSPQQDATIKADDALNILSLRTLEPNTLILPLDAGTPHTYDGILAQLTADTRSSDPERRTLARAIVNSVGQDADGRDYVTFSEENGDAVFIVNANPELPATPEQPTKAALTYTVAGGIAAYGAAGRAGRGTQDGEMLGLPEAFADVLDYRVSSLKACPYPVPFETDSRLPVVPQWYSVHTLARFVANDLHNRDRLLMGENCPGRFAIFAPLFDAFVYDIPWQELVSDNDPARDETMQQRRTLAGPKPITLRLNGDFERMGASLEVVLQRCRDYGFVPSLGADERGRSYWQNPRWQARDRPLFRKYLPQLLQPAVPTRASR